MNRWGNCCSEDNEGLNLAETVTAHPNAIALLQVEDFVENVKAKSTAFTKK